MSTLLGLGALGNVFAAHCQLAGIQLTAILPARLGEQKCYQSQVKLLPDTKVELQLTTPTNTIEQMFVALKAYQIEPAIKQLISTQKLAKNAQIILLNNGLGVYEKIRQHSPQADIINASVTQGALRLKPTQIAQTGIGQFTFGRLSAHNKSVPQWLVQLQQYNAESFCWQKTIATTLWQKLFINCLINPLTARDQIKNGQLLDLHYRAELVQLAQEIEEFCKIVGLPFTQNSVLEQVLKVAKNTSQNYSSMNRDLFMRRKTEIDFINGYLITEAEKINLSLPAHTSLYQTICSAETI